MNTHIVNRKMKRTRKSELIQAALLGKRGVWPVVTAGEVGLVLGGLEVDNPDPVADWIAGMV